MDEALSQLMSIKGVGVVTARRMVEAGLDSFEAIAAAGEGGLREIIGIPPRAIPGILEQAAAFAAPPEPEAADPVAGLKDLAEEIRGTIRKVAAATRQRFPDELAGTVGRKLTRNMVGGLDALSAIEDLLDRSPTRCGKALDKARKKIEGLADGDLKAVRKGLKKARKALERAID